MVIHDTECQYLDQASLDYINPHYNSNIHELMVSLHLCYMYNIT